MNAIYVWIAFTNLLHLKTFILTTKFIKSAKIKGIVVYVTLVWGKKLKEHTKEKNIILKIGNMYTIYQQYSELLEAICRIITARFIKNYKMNGGGA